MAVSIFTSTFSLAILSILSVDAPPPPHDGTITSSSSLTSAVDCSSLIPEHGGFVCVRLLRAALPWVFYLNVTKASNLPAACNVSAPSSTNCAGDVFTPTGAPGGAPTTSSETESANELAPAPALAAQALQCFRFWLDLSYFVGHC
ncbi:hypothetical protein F3Y22_tig00110831pilonHSYRG00513 [Hibiscus syriacus]|uniref:Bifunctional inhibitor/plant lipid transfer protein/seed storage helical domain-containing protein n=1 Tax=Hibiscus syriacus TaxID=106335 RepID=A0A6A2ZKY8_HIBSY|nr:hypothetical protein F3Y22_tig00110831pilonHSYRG00513 [Hibiscus syriacus]